MIAALLRRDLAQFFPFTASGAALPVIFFIAVAMLYPFAVGPDAGRRARPGGGGVGFAARGAAVRARARRGARAKARSCACAA